MVTNAVDSFVVNLVESVLIVIVLLFLGLAEWFAYWRSAFVKHLRDAVWDVYRRHYASKISLGALILALGMLVDNAIVVADGILVRVERGVNRQIFANCSRHAVPLLGATFISILAFTAIGFAPGNIGEFCRSLFDVMAISLMFSWILAVTITPLFCVWFLKIPEIHDEDPYDKPMYRNYRKLLHKSIHHRIITVVSTLLLLIMAIAGFKNVQQSFMPGSATPYFYLNYWLPEGAHIDTTSADVEKIAEFIDGKEGVKNCATFVGEGAMEFFR